MYDRFKWTAASWRRNRLTTEYEPLQPFLLCALGEGAGCRTFVDVGANIGAYSLFATLIPTIERVKGFEADPRTRSEFERNVALNGLANIIEVRGEAVSSHLGKITFGSVGELSGANSVVATSIHEPSAFLNCFEVDATTLDDIVDATATEPLLMKIDVEGHELAVLDGGEVTLRERRAILQVECYGINGEETVRRLEMLGFRRLTAIGPDNYFTNIPDYPQAAQVITAFSRAAELLIEYYHAERPLVIGRGDFSLSILGKSAETLRRLKRLIPTRK